MPRYAYACACGHKFERDRSMKESVGTDICPGCGKEARQDYSAKSPPQVGFIDGETSGYYGSKSGFPRDPNNPAKFIVPSKKAWVEYTKRREVEDVSG